MYAMDMRQYDPAIARWVVQDPVTHYDFSPYNAFDNNPVFWADPSGADSDRGIPINNGVVYGQGHWSDALRTQHWTGNNQSVTPPNDVTVNSNGVITDIKKNNQPNRYFDENGNQIFFNDNPNDSQWTSGLKVGDKLYERISLLFILQRLSKAGVTSRGGLGGMWRTAVDSYGYADFGVNQLKDIYNVNNTEYDGHTEGNGMFFRVDGQKSIYNFADFSQFLWGAWMKSNNYRLFEAKGGAHINNMLFGKGFFDTPADQRAIQNGFNYMTNLFNTWRK
jgi:hypothetical protein